MNKQIIKLYLFVGIGGMIGAAGRYGISFLSDENSLYPWSTLFVNITGSFLLSVILFHRTIKKRIPASLYTALTVGMIGSFTTFSTVTLEAIELWNSHPWLAVGYVLLSFFGSLMSCYVAFLLTKNRQVKT